jgi:PAS domain S-box-containing protein
MKFVTSLLLAGMLLAAIPSTTTSAASAVYSQGEILQFENISTEQGLSQSTVTAMLQDRQGFMWFGTESGLNKYDGYQFSAYKHDPDDPRSISSSVISSIYEDRDGILWIGTIAGLDRLDRKTGAFSHFQQEMAASEGSSERSILVITQDHRGTLWLGTEGAGLIALDLKANQFTVYENNPDDSTTLSDNTVRSIYEDRDGVLWIGTDRGLDSFDPTTRRFIHDQNSRALDSSINAPVYAINEDGQRNIWFGTQRGLFQWNRATAHLSEFQHNPHVSDSLSDSSIRAIFRDSLDTLWIGTRSGLDRFVESQKSFLHYKHNPNDPYSLISDSVRAVYEDLSGVLWIGTSGGGLSKYARASQKFNLYKTDPAAKSSLSDDNIWSVYEDHYGNLWIGTFSAGLNKLDRFSGTVAVYKNNPEDPTSLSNDQIRAILEDHEGNVWIGTEHGGLNQFNPQTGIFTRYQHHAEAPNSLGSDSVFAIYEDHMGRLWVGAYGGGLNLFDPPTGGFTHYQHDPEDPFSLSDNSVKAILEDGTGILWVGTLGGVNLFDEHTDRFTAYHYEPDNPSSLSSDLVLSISEDSEGTIWIGTLGGGLNRFDRAAGSFIRYTEKNGLPDNTVYGILAGADGNLWLSTNKGISKFDPHREIFRHYDASDGLQGDQFNPGAFFQNSNGEMYFGGTHGLNAFFPEQVTDNPVPPPLVITTFRKFNQVSQTDLIPNEPIQLSYRDSFISFEFAALDFNAPGKNQYAYRLEGFDRDWVQAGNQRYATYTNLPGGEYVFRVKAANNDGVWNEQGVSIPILITPPFWQTWWFIASLVVALSALIAGGFRWRLNTIREQNIYLEIQVSERTLELRETNKLLEKEVEQRKRAEAELEKRAAEQLQQSEERFRATFENSALGIVLAGLDSHARMVNPAIVRMTGYSEQELLQMSGLELSYPEDRELGLEPLQELLEGKRETYRFESRFVHKDGGIYWVRQTISAVRGSDGKPLYLVIMVENIEEQKRNLASLRESEERFRSMFEHAAVGIGVLGLSRRLIDANPALCRMYGRSRAELIGMGAAEITYPEDNPEAAQLFNELISGQRDSYEMDRRYIRRNGEVFWAHVTMSSVRGLDGKPIYLVGMVVDIDQQKHAAEELRKSQARFQAIFDNVAVGVAVMGLDRRPIAFNSATEKIIGYTFEEIRDTDPRLLAVPEDRGMDAVWFQELIEGQRNAYVMERRYRRKDGRIFWARINYSLVRDLQGNPDYLIGIIEDIDEQKRAAERLAQQEADYLLTLQHSVNERTRELEAANLRLQTEIEQRIRIEAELAETAATEAVTADRTRLARDLHDAVTQTLFSASLTAEVLPDLWDMDATEARKSTEELRQLTRGALAEMRTLLLELRPATLTQTRLSDLIKQLCEAFIGRSRLPIRLNIEGECELPPEVQVAFYRIAQESLNNVFKYARATQVDVNLFLDPSNVQFETCDNGIGFDLSTSKPTSLGMRIMRERAEAIGAVLQITSELGQGTCVALTWQENLKHKFRVL